VPANSTVLLKRAKSLLDEGDIVGARLILQHLAERGEADAAYELARTYDREHEVSEQTARWPIGGMRRLRFMATRRPPSV
jgi:hypothetical protein